MKRKKVDNGLVVPVPKSVPAPPPTNVKPLTYVMDPSQVNSKQLKKMRELGYKVES